MIADHVERALECIEELKPIEASAAKLLTQLDQSILAKAFRGELVPQDSNDEPASALIERIREARAQQKTKAKGKKNRMATR